jgi:hypothetical protein
LHGRADVIAGGDKNTVSAMAGAFVFMGDSIKTYLDSTLLLEFVDGSKVLVQPESHLELQHIGLYGRTGITDNHMHLRQGRVETQVEKQKKGAGRFEISTPAGITSVRGTDYRVSAESGGAKSYTEVLKGRVRVESSGKGEPVKAGFGTVSTAVSPPLPPIRLLLPIDSSLIQRLFERVPVQFVLPDDPVITGYRRQIADLI